MKLHVITVGKPKLAYAVHGWDEYVPRLERYYNLRVTHIADKHAYNAEQILKAAGSSYKVALEVSSKQLTSEELAEFLTKRELEAHEVSFIIGGPEGLPQAVKGQADFLWSLSKLTLPHDLAMVVLLETLYRSTTINAGRPYHK